MRPSELLAQPGAWTQGWPARKANGRLCMARNPEAVQWCIVGALRKTNSAQFILGAFWSMPPTLRTALHARGYHSLSRYNDAPGRTQDEVVALLIEAGL